MEARTSNIDKNEAEIKRLKETVEDRDEELKQIKKGITDIQDENEEL